MLKYSTVIYIALTLASERFSARSIRKTCAQMHLADYRSYFMIGPAVRMSASRRQGLPSDECLRVVRRSS